MREVEAGGTILQSLQEYLSDRDFGFLPHGPPLLARPAPARRELWANPLHVRLERLPSQREHDQHKHNHFDRS